MAQDDTDRLNKLLETIYRSFWHRLGHHACFAGFKWR